MKHLKIIPAVVAIIFIFFMGMNFKGKNRVWTDWLKGEKQIYNGNVNLWHIKDDFDLRIPYDSMVKKYEQKNFGVFINAVYLSADEAKEKIANGEYPDIVTYSKNFVENPKNEFAALDFQKNSMIKAGEIGGEIRAYPISYDSYTLIINDDILAEKDIDVPGIIDINFINTLRLEDYKDGVLPLAFQSQGAMMNFLATNRENIELEYNKASLMDFEKGKVVAFLCSTISLEKYQGQLPSFSGVNINSFTDRVRFLSVYTGNNDKNRLQCSKDIAKLFMQEKMQKQISQHGFSSIYGFTSMESKEVNPIKVFYDDLVEEKFLAMLKDDKEKLINKIHEISLMGIK